MGVIESQIVPMDVERGTACTTRSVVRIEAEDGSYRDFVGTGQGADNQDKAGGKASTYAWKDALVKGLCLPDADMVDTDDESDVVPVKRTLGAKAATKPEASPDNPYLAEFNPSMSADARRAKAKELQTASPADQAAILAAYRAK